MSLTSSSIRKFRITKRSDAGGWNIHGFAEYHTRGAGFTSSLAGEDFDAVERAVDYMIAEPACCGVTLECGLKIDEIGWRERNRK